MASVMPSPKQQYFDASGNPLVGGKVYTYAAGTSTQKATYQNASGSVPNPNPIVLDARGEAIIFWDGSYKVVVRDSSDNLIYAVDNYSTREVQSLWVSKYGAVGDGVTDDTAALQAAADDAGEGSTLEFEPGAAYKITGPVLFSKPHKLNGNGCTILAAGSLLNSDSTGFQIGQRIATYSSITPFTGTSGTNSFTVPSGVVLEAGNLVALMSNTSSETGYTHGQYAVVTDLSGSTATISTPFYQTYQVDKIRVYKGYESLVVNGFTFDWRNVSSTVAFTEAMSVYGSNIHIHGCKAMGNEYAGIGFRVEGENAVIENCFAQNFLNRQGISGGGRVGYGFAGYANNSIIRNNIATNCKHGITSGPRETMVVSLKYLDNKVYESATAPSTDYAGSIDIHSNATGNIIIRGNRVSGQNTLLTIRNEFATIENNVLLQTVGSANSFLITSFEQGFDGLVFRNNAVRLAGTISNARLIGTSGSSTTYFRNMQIEGNRFVSTVGSLFYASQAGTTIDNVRIANNDFSGDSLFYLDDDSATVDGLEIVDNRCDAITTAMVRVSSSSANTFNNIKIERNQAKMVAGGSSNNLVFFKAGAAAKDCKLSNVFIRDNLLDASLNTAGGYCIVFTLCIVSGLEVMRNKLLRTTGNFRSMTFTSSDLTDALIAHNQIESDMFFNAATLSGTHTRVRVADNVLRGGIQVSETSGDAVFVDCAIENNICSSITITNRVGSGAWASSNELPLTNNRTTIGRISISANSTGNKIRVRGGTNQTALQDNSSTFYAVPIHVAVQTGPAISWKGGTTVGYDGKLFAEAAPASGTWAVNEVVYDPTPAASGNIGFVCVTAGTPGTWKTWGAIAA